MFATLSLIRREFTAYFLSPIAYVVLAVFLFVTGHLFYLTLELLTARGPQGIEFPMRLMLGDEKFWLVFLFIPPLLTMRLFAEERSTGTLETLLTAPLRDWQVVLSKYLACFGFYVLLWLPTLVYLPVLLDLHATLNAEWSGSYSGSLVVGLMAGGLACVILALVLGLLPTGTIGRFAALALLLTGGICLAAGVWCNSRLGPPPVLDVRAGIDPMPVLSSYLGLALAGAMFLALGLLISSLVRSQMVAALISLAISLLFIVAGFWHTDMDRGTALYQVLFFFTVPLHFREEFSRGWLDTRPLVLYGSVTLFCLFLTVRSLESRRWR
jgi:ABC-type transport system involved in multi-copper enzyme maturation permease subunit